jgi:hypothetical protein
MAKRKHTYVNFQEEQQVPVFAKTTHAVATAAANQEDYFRVNGEYFEYIQTAQNDTIFPQPRTATPFGFTLPVDNTDGDGIELTQGIIGSGVSRAFTVGTDPGFYLKAGISLTTRAGVDVLAVGFRELGAYVNSTTPAAFLGAYDEKASIGVYNSNAGVLSTVTSLAGVDVATALAHAAWANGTSLVLEVYVSAAGVVTYKIDGAADASAVALTLTTGDVFVPFLVLTATGGGAPGVILQSWECGPTAL